MNPSLGETIAEYSRACISPVVPMGGSILNRHSIESEKGDFYDVSYLISL